MWRPRPLIQLPVQTERDIIKNLKSYAKKYDEQDEQLLAAADTEQMRVRQQKRVEWDAFGQSKQAWGAEQRRLLVVQLGHEPCEPESHTEEVSIQQIVEVREEACSG